MKYFIFSVIILLMVIQVNSNTCSGQKDENACPTHRPFCTTVGCVSSCVKPLYINGSNCVLHCGDSFVSDRTCIPFCSEDHFVRETLKVIGDNLYMEKECVTACYYHENIYNGSCETACPSNANFIINKNCSEKCPADQPYKRNYTKNGLLQHQCMRKCQKLSEDNFCTTTCSSGKVVFNSACILKCPLSHSYILGQLCVESCPNTTVHIENQTCMSYCPQSLPFVFNGSCVMSCPSKSMFHNFQNNLTFCVNECDKYISNKTCVDTCPSSSVIFNKTCLSECPSDFQFVTNVTEKYDCESDYCKTMNWYMQCTEKCPFDTFMFERICVTVCPGQMVVLNSFCVKDCDDIRPLIENSAMERTIWTYTERHIGWRRKEYVWEKKITFVNITQCVSNCSAGNVLMKTSSTCLDKCPDSHRVLNNNCVSKCPDTHRYEINTTLPLYTNCTFMQYWYGRCIVSNVFLTCKEICPIGTITYTNQCWYTCPKSMVMFNNDTCLSKCPESHPFHLEIDVPVPFPLDNFIKLDHDLGIVKPTTTCFDRCPHGYLHDEWRMKCVKICPYNASYIHQDTCLTACPEGLVKKKTRIGTTCLKKCPQGTVLNQQEAACMERCPPEAKYIYETVCLSKCPSSHRFGIKAEDFWETHRYICVETCEENDVYKDEDCIGIYSCNEPEIIFDGQCLLECPPGYLWFMTCFHKLGTIIAIPCVCILLSMIAWHMRLFLKDAYQVVRLSAFSHNVSSTQLNEERNEGLSYNNDIAIASPDDINLVLYLHNQRNDTDNVLEEHSHGLLVGNKAQGNAADNVLKEHNYGLLVGNKDQGNDADIELKEHNHNFLLGNNGQQGNNTNNIFFEYNRKSVNVDILVHDNITNDTGIDLCDNSQCRANDNTETAQGIDNWLGVSNQGFINDLNESSVEETVV